MTLHLGFDVHVMQASWYADAGAVRSHMICGISDTIKLDSNFSCGIEEVDIACAQSRASRDITLPTKVCIVKAMIFLVVMCDCERWSIGRQSTKESMPLDCGAGGDYRQSLGQQGDQTSQSYGQSTMSIHWKD